MEIRNGMLYLVTGCDKCCSWATKCCARSSNTSKFVLGRAIQEIQTVSGVNERNHQRDVTPGAANQTIFLRGYSISVRDRPALRVLGIKRDTTFMRILALPENQAGWPIFFFSHFVMLKSDHRMRFPTTTEVHVLTRRFSSSPMSAHQCQ